MQLPLNAMRAFESAARHLSFTRAGRELHVTQNAVSAQVKNLEARLGVTLFRRLPRGLALTDEGQALLPLLSESFERMQAVLEQFEGGLHRQVLTVAAVGTFNNNRVDLAAEGLDYAIRFGDGAWHATDALPLLEPLFTPLCTAATARRLRSASDLARETLLRSYRADEWSRWFAAAQASPPLLRGPVFDSSIALAEAAAQGLGVALLPAALFGDALRNERLVQPLSEGVTLGRYWLTRLKSRPVSASMRVFADWLATTLDAPA